MLVTKFDFNLKIFLQLYRYLLIVDLFLREVKLQNHRDAKIWRDIFARFEKPHQLWEVKLFLHCSRVVRGRIF